jgi:2-isopropylmalate synthase
VESVDLGLPGAGPRAFDDVLTLCREVVEQRLTIRPTCAARTKIDDIRPIVEVSQRTGAALEVMTFIGSSPIRQLAEDWSQESILGRAVESIDFAVREGLEVTFVTEDTTRSRPDLLRDLFLSAIDHGATGLCLCDTVGHATPDGVRNLVEFTRGVIDESGVPGVQIHWHGHNDRGFALVNSIFALEHGADRVHGCVLGIGERVGNAAIDLLLINLKLLGELPDRDLSQLSTLCRKVSNATRFPIPINYPVVGRDAFRTATGVHAAAIIKAQGLDHEELDLADRIYSGVPAGMIGREQEICVGPMSGVSNVIYWLARRGIAGEPALVQTILRAAKRSDQLLTDDELLSLVHRHERRAVIASG